jgi:hypothetical protein
MLGYDAFLVEVAIISVTEKTWSRFKCRSKSVIDNITSQDSVMYQKAKIRIVHVVYLDENISDNGDIIMGLLKRKLESRSEVDT